MHADSRYGLRSAGHGPRLLSPAHFGIVCLLAAALIAGGATRAAALDGKISISQYAHDKWTTDQLLPQNTVYSIVQTSDGYLWLGTWEGVARFDGLHFVTLDGGNTPALRSNVIQKLMEDSSHALWIGTRGGGLTNRQGDQFHTITTKEGLPSNFVNAVVEDRRRDIWIGTERGLCRLSNGHLTTFRADDGFPAESFVSAIVEDRNGTIWIGTSASGLFSFADGRFMNRLDESRVGEVVSLEEDHGGAMWIGGSRGLHRLAGSDVRSYSRADGLPHERVNALLEDEARNLWIGTSGGIARLTGGALTSWTEADGLSNNFVHTLAEDREHNIWIGTDGGLDRLRDSKFVPYTRSQGLHNEFVWALLPDRRDGTLWLGTQAGLAQLAGPLIRPVGPRQLERFDVHALFQDQDDSLWLGIMKGGLGHYQHGAFRLYTTADGLASDSVESVYRDREGRLWAATRGGLSRLEGQRFITLTRNDGLPENRARVILQDRRGTLWIGTFGGGLCRYETGRFHCLTTNDGLASNMIVALREDARGALWISTRDGGISRLIDGRLHTYTVRQGLFDNTAHTTIEDGHGYVWISCNKGIYRVRLGDFDDLDRGAISRLHADVFQTADGMRSREANSGTPASARTADGRLWFTTVRGVVAIDPHRMPINTLAPPVVVENLTADGQALAGADLAAGTRNLQIDYTALSFRVPERVRFKYRLEGYDRDWIDAGNRRSAYYTNLSPGTFRSRVSAANDDGV